MVYVPQIRIGLLIDSRLRVAEPLTQWNTRKPCYRKDDRAMRPIYGCPEKFRESSQTPPATFPEICKELLFGWTL